MKTTQLMDPPTSLLALGHHNDSTVRLVLETCFGLYSTHPRIVKLPTGPLYEESVCFLAGEDLRFPPRLAECFASYMFGYANEQRREGLHAQVECTTGSIQNQSEANDSLVKRILFFNHRIRAKKARTVCRH